ncbi:MAG TPA: methylated-DNA--[protein]-cysteine S-methyltransferase [Candidatus Angelobacter sp.]|nr:methylated-DNA--[protein]-cysteine S-methyltransferase [Candidatus Angelobacter sp.]
MRERLRLFITRMSTPIGELLLVTDEQSNLRAVDWHDYEDRMRRLLTLHYGKEGFLLEPVHGEDGPTTAMTAMAAYFAGDLAAIDRLAVRAEGTEFQRKVWAALREIPYGSTLSYGELARKIGKPDAVRAVGTANGANPISIVVPCHRVIGANGSLTGYGGGMERKRWLLAHEGARLL